MRTQSKCMCFLVLVCAATGRADNWPAWRGPHATGVSEERDLPTAWSATKNIR